MGDLDDQMKYATPENSQAPVKAMDAIHTSPKRFEGIRSRLSRGLDKVRRRVLDLSDSDDETRDVRENIIAAGESHENQDINTEAGMVTPEKNPEGPIDSEENNPGRKDAAGVGQSAGEKKSDGASGQTNPTNATTLTCRASKGKTCTNSSLYSFSCCLCTLVTSK